MSPNLHIPFAMLVSKSNPTFTDFPSSTITPSVICILYNPKQQTCYSPPNNIWNKLKYPSVRPIKPRNQLFALTQDVIRQTPFSAASASNKITLLAISAWFSSSITSSEVCNPKTATFLPTSAKSYWNSTKPNSSLQARKNCCHFWRRTQQDWPTSTIVW